MYDTYTRGLAGSNPVLATNLKKSKIMKIKVEIVTDELNTIELNTISTKYIDVENYQHTKDFHVESILEEMVDEMLLDIKWELEKLKK